MQFPPSPLEVHWMCKVLIDAEGEIPKANMGEEIVEELKTKIREILPNAKVKVSLISCNSQ